MLNEGQKRTITKYIRGCYEVIDLGDNNLAYKLSSEIITIFKSIIPDIADGIDSYDLGDINGGTPDYLGNIRILKNKLESLVEKNGTFIISQPIDKSIKSENDTYNISNTTKNNNTNDNKINNTISNTTVNKIDIKTELNRIREEIEADEMLGDADKEEISEKLNEIETVMDQNSTHNEKWKKLKGVISWVITKGYKVGQMIMPLITKALFPEE